MELFGLFLILLIIILFAKIRNLKFNLIKRILTLEVEVQKLRRQTEHLQSLIAPPAEAVAGEPEQPSTEEEAPPERPVVSVSPATEALKPERPQEHHAPPPLVPDLSAHTSHKASPKPSSEETPAQTAVIPSLLPRLKQALGEVDWEQFTGIKLFAWLGGLALFIAAGFFVKYSIDQNLISPFARLTIGAVIGLGLILWSLRFERGRYDISRHTLGAGGIGVLYAVVFAATLYYEFITKTHGFCMLAVISATAFVLSIFHRGITISVLGAIGAYITPLLVSTGQGSLILLFIYLLIVNSGLFQVVIRLKAGKLLFVAIIGTLTTLLLAALGHPAPVASLTMGWIWIVNLAFFSLLLGILNTDPAASRLTSYSFNLLYGSIWILALCLTLHPGTAPLQMITAAMTGAVALALRNKGWYPRIIPFAALYFVAALFFTALSFDTAAGEWQYLLFLLYGVAGGLGPVILIRQYGVTPLILKWFKIFPAAVVGLSLLAFWEHPEASFWFWPLILSLQLIGIFISLLFGFLIQMGVLTLILIFAGLSWIIRISPFLVGTGFFMVILVSGILLCAVSLLILKHLAKWSASLHIERNAPLLSHPLLTNWMVAAPSLGAFLVVGVSIWVQSPFQPGAGLATLICLLILNLFLCKRLAFQPLGVVALVSAAMTQGFWILRCAQAPEFFIFGTVCCGLLFVAALRIPHYMFPGFTNWSQIWKGWALFELSQGVFLLHFTRLLWSRELAGWLPLLFAFLKLPGIRVLLRTLERHKERNAILAFHGGVLLFYVSALPILLMTQGWIGLTLIIEAAALLWLNRRIEHPGLRWVAVGLAPVGLLILIPVLTQLKSLTHFPVLNAAVLSVALGVIALGLATRWAPYPKRFLNRLDLLNYFKWLFVGTAFFLVNLIIADVFAGPDISLQYLPQGSSLHAVCYFLAWTAFGAVLWKIRSVTPSMRITGLILILLGTGGILGFPFVYDVTTMRPFSNTSLVAFPPLLLLLLGLFFKEPRQQGHATIKNLFLALFLMVLFLGIKVTKTTLFQTGQSFQLFAEHTAAMAVASAFGWTAYGLALLVWPKGLDRPFRLAGLVLLLLGFAKAMLFPFRFRHDFGQMTPLLNMPTLLFLCCIVSNFYLLLHSKTEHWPLKRIQPKPFWGTLLAGTAFVCMNIEIASFFKGHGHVFSLMPHGSLAHQLGYSMGWLVFAIATLAIGIRWHLRHVRWGALALLTTTSLKIFLMDLWSLGQLYRVAAFVGLAVISILVSYLYQRFLADEPQ